jgi:hypothetical protein
VRPGKAILGALPRELLEERLSRWIDTSAGLFGCWPFTGTIALNGYGQLRIRQQLYLAHRVSFELAKGPVPAGLELDHLCRNRRCINPAHLEAVTTRENVMRGLVGGRIACVNGHPYDQANTYRSPAGKRKCRTCRRLGMRVERTAA